jgi:glutamyl-tRNA reductase
MAPAIVGVHEELENWRKGEIERWRPKLGALTPQQEEAIHAMMRGYMNKVAHRIISELKRPKPDRPGDE